MTDTDKLIAARDWILRALLREMRNRPHQPGLEWIEAERIAVAVAATQRALAHGVPRSITVDDVEHVEQMAVGHIDYATKLALYVAELLYGRNVHQVKP